MPVPAVGRYRVTGGSDWMRTPTHALLAATLVAGVLISANAVTSGAQTANAASRAARYAKMRPGQLMPGYRSASDIAITANGRHALVLQGGTDGSGLVRVRLTKAPPRVTGGNRNFDIDVNSHITIRGR